jgi:hypothetical protein
MRAPDALTSEELSIFMFVYKINKCDSKYGVVNADSALSGSPLESTWNKPK